jgi:hypothetical protein
MGTIINIDHTSVGTILTQAEFETGAHGFTAPIIFNNNAATPPTSTSNTVAHFAQSDGNIGRVIVDVYGTSTCAVFEGRAARGTGASRSALQSGDQIVELSAHGYGATGYSSSGRGHVRFEADGNWTDASQPTRLVINVTPSASITPVEAMRILNSGYIGINYNAPDTYLHIYGDHVGGTGLMHMEGTTHGYLTVEGATGYESGFLFQEGGTRYWQIKQMPTTHAMAFTLSSTQVLNITATAFDPVGTGLVSSGTASNYWNDISYKTLTDRGCLGWFDDGVELQDGTIVSDVAALLSIKKHPTKKTVYGTPMLDYSTFPKVSYKPAPVAKEDVYDEFCNIDEESTPSTRTLKFKAGEKMGEDGIEMTSMFSIIIGAIKENSLAIKDIKEHLSIN